MAGELRRGSTSLPALTMITDETYAVSVNIRGNNDDADVEDANQRDTEVEELKMKGLPRLTDGGAASLGGKVAQVGLISLIAGPALRAQGTPICTTAPIEFQPAVDPCWERRLIADRSAATRTPRSHEATPMSLSHCQVFRSFWCLE